MFQLCRKVGTTGEVAVSYGISTVGGVGETLMPTADCFLAVSAVVPKIPAGLVKNFTKFARIGSMPAPLPVQTPAGIEPAFDLAVYYPILIYAIVVVLFAARHARRQHLFPFKPRKPTRVKQMPYESGMDPIGDGRQQFDVKFYLIAILFLVFDVELLFLYPWAVIAYARSGGDPTLATGVRRAIVFCGNAGVPGHAGGRLCLRLAEGGVPDGGERPAARRHGDAARLRWPTWCASTACGRCRSPRPAAASS